VTSANVELVQAMDAAFVGDNPASALAFVAEDCVLDFSWRPGGGVYQGHQEIAHGVLEWMGTWENWQLTFEKYIEVDDERVVAFWHESGRGKGSGIAYEQRGANVYRVRGGQLIEWKLFRTRADALAAVGLAGAPE
jgi:hypothetical protein